MGAITRQRRREIERAAAEIRVQGERACWPIDRIVQEILSRLPEVLPLEAFRFAHGWPRPEVCKRIDGLYEDDGLQPPAIATELLCKWEHGVHVPNDEHRGYLCRLYQTGPDKLGFGKDYTPSPASAAEPPEQASVTSATIGLPPLLELSPEAVTEVLLGEQSGAVGNGTQAGSADPGQLLTSLIVAALLSILRQGVPGMNRRALLQWLGVIGVGAGVGSSPHDPEPWERLEHVLRHPARIDEATVSDLEAVTAGFFGLEERVPTRRLFAGLSSHLGTVAGLLETSPSEGLLRRLAATAGESAALAGWFKFDLKDHASARRLYRVAATAADKAGDKELLACTLGYRSYLESAEGDAQQARTSLREAQASASDASTVTWLACREAEESAILGDEGAALAALERAESSYVEAPSGEQRVWTAFFDRSRMDSFAVTTYVRLGRPEAQGAADKLLASLAPSEKKTRSIILADVSGVHIRRGDAEQGCSLASEALTLAMQTECSLALQRLQTLQEPLRPLRKALPAARSLDEQLRAASLTLR